MSAAQWDEGRRFLRRLWFVPVIVAILALLVWVVLAAVISLGGAASGSSSYGSNGGVTDLTTPAAPRWIDPFQTPEAREDEFRHTLVHKQIEDGAYVFGYSVRTEVYALDIPDFAAGSVNVEGQRVSWAVSQDEVVAYYDSCLRGEGLIPGDAVLRTDASTLAKPFRSGVNLSRPAIAVWTVKRTAWSPGVIAANLLIPPVLGFGVGLFVLLVAALILSLVRKPGHCVFCGYDRAGLPAGAACPECGSYPVGHLPAVGRRPDG